MGALLGLVLGVGLCLVWFGARGELPPRRATGRPSRADVLLRRAGVEGVNGVGLVAFCLGAGLLAGLVVLVISRTQSVAAVFAVLAGYLPMAVLSGRAHCRRREFAELWPEAVDNLASAVRAGLSLPEALAALGERGPEPLRAPFVKFALDYQSSGRFGDCLDLLKDRLADPVGDRVVEALRIARDVGGGDLGRMLRALSGFLRDDARTRAELEARQAWSVNAARLATAAPWVVLLLMSLQPDVITRYASTAGAVVLGGGAATCVLAYRLMTWLGRLPNEERILA
ncbi:MAG: type II secretion system F family protein [Actinomycetota bacterium]|nr:type II secretion system F family protein [Actinomycetota bacterium]